MSREEASGGSCGVSSGAGQGPLYNARRNVRDQVISLSDGLTNSWFQPVQADLERLRGSVATLEGATIEERQRAFEARATEIRSRARSIAARSNEFGKATAAEMIAIATTVSVAPGQPGFSCYDPTLAQRLTQAAQQAEQPAVLNLRDAAFNEGPAGVANAIKGLWSNIGAHISHAWNRLVSGRPSQLPLGQLSGRDLIALLATIGVDLGLLALAALNPPAEAPVRRWGAAAQAELAIPTREVVQQLNAAIDTAIADAPNADRTWVRRHFVHHRERSYLVIPNLASCRANAEETARGLAMNQLAGVLTDLDLVRWPHRDKWWGRKHELKELLNEETGGSLTDLTKVRQERLKQLHAVRDDAGTFQDKESQPLRNHGLFSKAEVALELAGWSALARADIEVLPLVETEGLTPLLMVLNQREHLTKVKDGADV
jgi:hypothetical protein